MPTAHSGGQEIKWTFDRGSEAFSQPWMTSATNPGVFAPYAMNTPMDPNITHGFDDVFTNPYAVSAVQTPPYTQVGFGDLDLLWAYGSRVLVDHVEEHTVRAVLDEGFWAGMTLYPVTKCTPQRAADIIEMYGPERLMVNSAGDWGPSKPTAVPDFILEMRRRGHAESLIRRVVHDNPLTFFQQSRNFKFTPREESAVQAK